MQRMFHEVINNKTKGVGIVEIKQDGNLYK